MRAPRGASLAQRVWPRVQVGEGCWLWTGYVNPQTGYGQLTVHGATCYAHRLVYELAVGPIPDGLEIDHLCMTKACVRPDHLEPVTHRENLRRGPQPEKWQLRKTHCPAGHPYEGDNLRRYRTWRYCRACKRAWARQAGQRKRDAA